MVNLASFAQGTKPIVLDVVDPDVSDNEIWSIYQNENYKLHIDIVNNLPLDPARTYTLEDMDDAYSYIYNKNEIVEGNYGSKNWKRYEFTSISLKIGENNELEAVIEAKNGEDVISGTFVFDNPDPITVTVEGEAEYIADIPAYSISAKNAGSALKADYSVQFGIKGDAYESKTSFTIDDLMAKGNSICVASVETKITAATINLTVDGESQTFEGTVVGADGKNYAINVTTNVPSKEAKKETIDFGSILAITEDEGDIKLVAQDENAKFVGYITVNPVTTDIPSGDYNLLSYTKYGANSDYGYMLDAVEDGKVTVTNNEGEISIVATFKQNNTEYTVTASYAATDDGYDGPAILFDVEEGTEVDLEETKSINVNVDLPDGMNAATELFIEGVLFGMDGTNQPVFGFTDFEDGVLIPISRLTPGNSYQIQITKIAFGEEIDFDAETYMPIFENEFEAEEGKALATLNFSIAMPTVEVGDITATYYAQVPPVIDIVFEDQEDVVPTWNVDILLDGVKLNCEYGQEWNEIYGYPSSALAAGEHTIVFPVGSLMFDGSVTNDTECSVKFTVESSSVTLNAAGYATFSCKDATTIVTEGVKAYKAAVDLIENTITLTELTGNIPAGTGVILYGEAGAEVEFALATSGELADVSGNDLKATTKADGSLAERETGNWVLGDGNEFLVYIGTVYSHNHAYIYSEYTSSAMRIVFADKETDAINNAISNAAVREGKFVEDGKIVIIKNGAKYNVAGQAVK